MYNARMLAKLKQRLDTMVWGDVLSKHGPLGRGLAKVFRSAYAILRDIMQEQLALRSMSLVYTTLLSIVPLLAVSFSVLNSLGAAAELETRLGVFLEPLGQQGEKILQDVMAAVKKVNFVALGSVGLAFFIYTAISMVQKVEESFNYVWYVAESRSFGRRVAEYFLVLTVGPLLMVLALGILTSLQSEELVQYLIGNDIVAPFVVAISKMTPFLIIICVFTFLYMFMPNTRVRFTPALVGGMTAGLLWGTTSFVFTSFVVGSQNRQAVYGAFAIAIVALIWLYLNWLILLIGSQVAFYVQNPAYLRLGRREPRLSCSMRERLALNIMYLVGVAFRDPEERMDVARLSEDLQIPSLALSPILNALHAAGLLTTLDDDTLQPGRDMSRMSLNDIMAVVRIQGETGSHRAPHWAAPVSVIGNDVDAAISHTLGDQSLADLVDAAATTAKPAG